MYHLSTCHFQKNEAVNDWAGDAANNKREKVIKLIDPDNENISFSNNNVGLVIYDIATPKPSYPNPLPNQYILRILQFCHK